MDTLLTLRRTTPSYYRWLDGCYYIVGRLEYLSVRLSIIYSEYT
jgi:hypothetical protein